MKSGKSRPVFLFVFVIALSLGIGYLLISDTWNNPALSGTPGPTRFPAYAPTNVWSTLLEVTPVPYASPLPDPNPSPLDGTYAKYDPAWPQWWSCQRCADYRPAGGAWRLQFDKGVMRIYYEVTGWNSLASYSISGDRLYLFNDPYCNNATGEYVWKVEDGNLTLKPVQDSCSFQLRSRNLGGQSWSSCDAGEQKPRGCEDPSADASFVAASSQDLNVIVHQADVRKFSGTPDVFVNAGGAKQPSIDGIRISYSDESILYGISRVLWADDDWVEVTTDLPFTSMGVQFRGDYVIGWARVLFDGEEVWRGDTSKIWSYLRDHGGYIEISGFEPGVHTIRVERLEVDSRPVVVAFFGFNQQGGVEK